MSYEQAMRWAKKHPRGGARQPVLSANCQANIDRRIAPMLTALADARKLFKHYTSMFEPMGCDCTLQHHAVHLLDEANCPLSAFRAGRAALNALEDMWPDGNYPTGFKHKEAITAAMIATGISDEEST